MMFQQGTRKPLIPCGLEASRQFRPKNPPAGSTPTEYVLCRSVLLVANSKL